MTIHDFPAMPFPDVEIHQLSGFRLKVVHPSVIEGLCECCHKRDSSHIFNVGATLHHLCRECFEKMLSDFHEQTKK